MKRILTIALVLLSTLFIAGTSSAQEHLVKATVPFNFTVGDFTVPAGTYTIDSSWNAPDVLVLRNLKNGIKIFAFGVPNQDNPERRSVLVFHHYGIQYFLSQIRTEGASINMNFAPSKAEKKARARVEIAGRFVDDPVLIALSR